MNATFGPYRLLRRLAYGGMAEIFLATMTRDAGFEKRLVVKRILPQFSADPGFVQMFIDEAVVAGRLSHPNIVQVYDFGNVDGVYYMTMEYIDGADLRQVLRASEERGRPLTFAEIAAIGEGVARGLAYAHSATDERLGPLHIVHRDVSPHNIMVSRAGDVKVMDFGIAKAAARATRTTTGTLKGKIAYMAPEQAAGRPLDGRCDQFALGVVLWECLSRRRLFAGDSDLELLNRVLACEVPPLEETRPEVPPALAAAVMRSLQPDPPARFADVRELERALATYRFSLGQAGAVQLGALVDELTPKAATPERRTQSLPDDDSERPAAYESASTLVTPSGSPPRWGYPDAATIPVASSRSLQATMRTMPFGEEAAEGSSEFTTSDEVDLAPPITRAQVRPWVLSAGVTLGVVALVTAAWLLLRHREGAQPRPQTSVLQVENLPAGASQLPAGTGADTRAGAGVQAGAGADAPRPSAIETDVLSRSHPASAVETPVAGEEMPAAAEIAAETVRPLPRGRTGRPRTPTGRLSLRSRGAWVDVYLGKRKLGSTPLDEVAVPAGTLRLRLTNVEAGIDDEIEIEVRPGALVRHTIEP